jgi:hypothetical protein
VVHPRQKTMSLCWIFAASNKQKLLCRLTRESNERGFRDRYAAAIILNYLHRVLALLNP